MIYSPTEINTETKTSFEKQIESPAFESQSKEPIFENKKNNHAKKILISILTVAIIGLVAFYIKGKLLSEPAGINRNTFETNEKGEKIYIPINVGELIKNKNFVPQEPLKDENGNVLSIPENAFRKTPREANMYVY